MEQNGKEINPFTHFYLYAKGWYVKTNIMDDLKKIAGHYSWIDPKYITEQDVKSHLTNLAYETIKKSGNPEYHFQRFVSDIEGGNLIDSCLGMLRFCDVLHLNIGEPDAAVLPLQYSDKELQ